MLLKRILQISKKYNLKLSVRFASTAKPSYLHCADQDPLKYVTLGKVLKNAAEKYSDRLSLISCSEKSQISFNEALFKVRIISMIINKNIILIIF